MKNNQLTNQSTACIGLNIDIYYDYGEKISELLSWCITALENERAFDEIVNIAGDLKIDPSFL